MNQTTAASQQYVLRWMYLVLAVLVYQNNKKALQREADINILLHDIEVGRLSGYYPEENLWGIVNAQLETMKRVIQLGESELKDHVEYGQCYAMKKLYSVYQEDEQNLVWLFGKVRKSLLRLAA